MKCPHCARAIGIPYNRIGIARCSYCNGKITYAFNGKKASMLLIPAGALAWLLHPYIGGVSFLLFFTVVLLPSVYLVRWF